jgi:hypothetical protein
VAEAGTLPFALTACSHRSICAEGDTGEYDVGDLVWAKPFANQTFWPAQIADTRRSNAALDKRRRPGEYVVYLFGTHD